MDDEGPAAALTKAAGPLVAVDLFALHAVRPAGFEPATSGLEMQHSPSADFHPPFSCPIFPKVPSVLAFESFRRSKQYRESSRETSRTIQAMLKRGPDFELRENLRLAFGRSSFACFSRVSRGRDHAATVERCVALSTLSSTVP